VSALNNLHHLHSKEERFREAKWVAAKAQQQALEAWLFMSTQLLCLKKVYKKV